jgi:hypothetical protein
MNSASALTTTATVAVMSRYATEPATSYPDDPGATTYQVPMPAGDVPVTVTRRGQGRPVLLLHGGAGPDSVAGSARFALSVVSLWSPVAINSPRC